MKKCHITDPKKRFLLHIIKIIIFSSANVNTTINVLPQNQTLLLVLKQADVLVRLCLLKSCYLLMLKVEKPLYVILWPHQEDPLTFWTSVWYGSASVICGSLWARPSKQEHQSCEAAEPSLRVCVGGREAFRVSLWALKLWPQETHRA